MNQNNLLPHIQKIQDMVNEMLNSESINIRFRYFTDAKKNRYFWTTEPINKDGKKRFVSGVWRYFKTKNSSVMKKEVYHTKRNKAKARAIKLYNKSGGNENARN